MLPSFTNNDLNTVKSVLDKNGISNKKIYGNGNKVINQYPSKGVKVNNTDTVYLITNDNNIKVPDVHGLSSKEAKSILTMLGLKVKLEGNGYVVDQSLKEGTNIVKDAEITIKLEPKFKT